MRLAFCGSPGWAVPALDELSPHLRLVVTRPPAPRGRGRKVGPSPVEARARELGLPVVTPGDQAELTAALEEASPLDAAVVVAYGMIIPGETLRIPRRGFLNLHFSLLPRWRGPEPVRRALLAGDDTTGVSVMSLDEGVDTGGVLAMWATRIGPAEDAGSLTDRLARWSAPLGAETVESWVSGGLTAVAQPGEGATYAHKIRQEERRLHPDQTPESFVRTVRAMAPAPGAVARVGDGPLKVLAAAVSNGDLAPGELRLDGDRLLCGLVGGVVELKVVQAPGKRPMSGAAWARGRRALPPMQ
ncbi:MAG: methionyl-tRNA formyltransferase [Acidimicrobiia bacterium]|nr:MAG: methionyl-tRNA formyltransferase [Acidimicrobiia bacterium]